jgi:hypothetical protein
VIPPRLKGPGRRLWPPVVLLAAALVLAVGLRFTRASTPPAVVAEANGELPSLPAVDVTPSAPVVPVVERRTLSQLDRVFASVVVAMRARGGESAVRELRHAETMWETGRRRDCARQASDDARARCTSRLATLRAQELSELLERTRSR